MNKSEELNKNLSENLRDWYYGVCQAWQKDGKNQDKLKQWIRKKYINGEEEQNSISFTEPFCTAVLDNYDTNKSTIMFVGQEPNGYGDIKNFKNNVEQSIKESQNWLIEFLKYNLKSPKPKEKEFYSVSNQEIPYKKTAFIKALRTLPNDYNICWNNIDKIQYKTNNIKGIKLYSDDEKILNGYKINDKNTLLLQEIGIVKPNIIIFAIGPSYKDSLEVSLNMKLSKECCPNKNKPIGKCFNIGTSQCFWTYHPRYCKFNINSIKVE